ncbi:LytR/AlgR family response regulator transcription factor [Spirosoma aerolatum]|uniref:LytR/AlgR family response regulator transcription factor n=1 Tax=Spirosoma aerolatum TaxID=1211326 RepID=UPI0009ABB2FC|nr:LytTR family DNA-binding domain-containing protein [Spirosoma aerolatum]
MTSESTESLNCLIYEETYDASRWLKQHLHNASSSNTIRVVSEIGQFEKRLQEDDYNLAFVVVEQLPIQAFLVWQELDFCPPILVCSANRAVAADAFMVGAAGFVSPDNPTLQLSRQIREVLAQNRLNIKVLPAAKAPTLPFFFVKSDYKIVRLNFDDVLFVEGLGEYLRIYTDTAKHIVLQSFSKMADVLPSHQFLRIHRSYMVNLYKINFIQNNVVSIGNHQLPISKSQKKTFLELIEHIGLL